MRDEKLEMMGDYYILKDRIPAPATLCEYAQWMDDEIRRVALDERDGVRVSTVFLGMDHSFGHGGPPILFETMVFGGEHDEYQERCSTYEEAEAMHHRVCALVRGIQP